MTHQLDPFQTVIFVPPSLVFADDAGVVEIDDNFGSFNLNYDCSILPCSIFNTVPWASYQTQVLIRLSSPLFECAQADWQVTGRTSGVTKSFSLLPSPYDCEDLCLGICVYEIDSNTKSQQSDGVLGFGGWRGPPRNYWQVGLVAFDKNQRGYTLGERVDVTFNPGRKVNIVSITERIPSGLWVDVLAHGQPNGSYVSITGTVNYDGTYEVSDSTTDKFSITAAYVEDEFIGQVAPDYSIQVP